MHLALFSVCDHLCHCEFFDRARGGEVSATHPVSSLSSVSFL